MFAFVVALPVVLVFATPCLAIVCAGTTIDGYSQPGTVPNTISAGGNNADIGIILNGSACGVCSGLSIAANNVTIRGLSIHSFNQNGILVSSGAGVAIRGNYLGTDPGGMANFGNGISGVGGPAAVVVGGPGTNDRNLITGNQAYQVSTGTNSVIENNQLGGDRAGGTSIVSTGSGFYAVSGTNMQILNNTILGHNGHGIFVSGTSYATVNGNNVQNNSPGGAYFGYCCVSATGNQFSNNNGPGVELAGSGNHNLYGNTIANNNGDGVLITSSSNFVYSGTISANDGAGIRVTSGSGNQFSEVNAAGNTAAGIVFGAGSQSPPNDEAAPPYDQDTGPNSLTNTPVISSVVHSAGNTIVTGSVKTAYPTHPAWIELFSNPGMPALPQGATYQDGPPSITLDADGLGTFTFTIPGIHDFISATVTIDECFDACMESSGYSAAVAAGPPVAPVLQAMPGALSFGNQGVGTVSSPQTVTLTNLGPGDVNIASLTSMGEFSFNSDCGAVLMNGQSCAINVDFRPLVAGMRTGNVTVSSDASVPTFVISLSGNGTPPGRPAVSIDPIDLDFGAVRVGESSAYRVIRVSNTGQAPLTMSYTVTSDEFVDLVAPMPSVAPKATRVVTDGTAGNCYGTVQPGQFCEIHLVFAPAAGGPRSGEVIFVTDADSLAPNVRLRGFGAGAEPVKVLEVASTLQFPDQIIGVESSGTILKITNASRSTVTLESLAVEGADFKVGDGCTVIEAGATCERRVFFKPSALGARSGRITIRVPGEADPYLVALVGTGVTNPVPQLGVAPRAIGFGSVLGPAGSSVRLTNEGQLPVRFTLIAPLGAFMAVSRCGEALAVGASCLVDVTFFPTLGLQTGTLQIFSNAAGSPHRVDLSATGCKPPAAFNRTRTLPCS